MKESTTDKALLTLKSFSDSLPLRTLADINKAISNNLLVIHITRLSKR